MGYAFIDHTADVAADLTGRSVDELFLFAAQALTDTITDIRTVQPVVTQSVTLEAHSPEDLLVDWLNELLYRFEVQNVLFSDGAVTVREVGERWHLAARITGEPFEPTRHPSRVQVKSATYHGLNVTHTSGTWNARIVFDV